MAQDRRDEKNPPRHGPQLPFLSVLSHMACLSSGQRFWGEGLGLKWVVSMPAIPNGGYSASLVVRKWGECQVRGSRP